MTEEYQETSFPDHVDKAVRSVTQLHSDHHGRTTSPQRAVNRVAALMGRPWFTASWASSLWLGLLQILLAAKLGIEAA